MSQPAAAGARSEVINLTINGAPGQSPEDIGRAAVGAMIDARLSSLATRDRLEYGYARDAAGRDDRP